MYKKILALLSSICLIGLIAQGYYLLQTLQTNKVKQAQQTLYTQHIDKLKAKLQTCEGTMQSLDKQLHDKHARIEQEPIPAHVIDKARKATVTIKTTSPLSAYFDKGTRYNGGTGVIVNKAKGLILTNSHMIIPASISTYEAVTYNGHALKATLLYYHPWVDVAILQVDSSQLTDEQEAKLSEQQPTLNQPIFITGNNERNSHSIHTGRISQLQRIGVTSASHTSNSLPQPEILYNLNSTGGASGSGVYNYQGDILALNYAGNSEETGHGITLKYLKHILTYIQQGQTPPGQHIGIITQLAPLADIIKYGDLSKEDIHSLKNDLPKHVQDLIIIRYTLKGSPAEGILHPGDIIYKVNNQLIGNDLTKLDLLMSKSQNPDITLTLFRQGQKIQRQVKLYDIHQHTIKKMVVFGGATFFQTDDHWADYLNVPAGTLTFCNIEQGSSFNTSKYFGLNNFYSQVNALDGISITNLDQLIQHIPQLIKKGHFTIDYTNCYKCQRLSRINYSKIEPAPIIYTYNTTTKRWDKQVIQQAPHKP